MLDSAHGVDAHKRSCSRKILRLIRLVHYLLREPALTSTEFLESELGATRRTILRDLELLRQAGLAVEFNHAEGHYWVKEAGFNNQHLKSDSVSSLPTE